MNAKKLVKWGVALTSTLVLGGVVGTEAGQLLGGSNVVYAQEWRDVYLDIINIDQDGNEINRREVVVASGETVTILMEAIPGYRSNEQYSELTISYMEVVFLGPRVPIYNRYVSVETPTDQPAATPTAQPVDQPAEKPVDQPVKTPVGQPTETPATTPIEQPVEQPAETPTDQPTDQPTTTPTDQPVEKPVDQPANQPTEKPTATSLLAGNTTSKAQTGATTDKKKVDNSTPSTNTVKPEEGSQATAKTLPKTGDSGSMLLVLGGLLSGLSGLGLVATSRKRD